MEKTKINLTGEEIVSLAGSLAICLSKKYCNEDLCTLRTLFSSLAQNIAVIEFSRK